MYIYRANPAVQSYLDETGAFLEDITITSSAADLVNGVDGVAVSFMCSRDLHSRPQSQSLLVILIGCTHQTLQ